MKNLLIFLTLSLTLNLNAQIKEQFQAESASNTTIVIKENRASDEEILAQNFNLDDYRVGDVIRITTSTEERAPRVAEKRERTATRVKRKKKKSFKLFSRPLRGNRKFKKSNFRSCYRF